MTTWIIRTGAPSVVLEASRVVLRSRRRISIRSGDELVLLSRESVFVNKAQVVEVRQGGTPYIVSSDEEEKQRWWEVHIEDWKKLRQEIALADASTSLTFIRNWKRPKVHVRLAYRRLPDADMETLERGELFIARDTYLHFLDALPPRLVQLFLAENPPRSVSWTNSDYAERARALINFIEAHVLCVGRVALATQKLWVQFLTQVGSPDAQRLYLWDEIEAGHPIDFTSQVDAFRTLLPDTEDSGSAGQLTEIAELLDSRRSIEDRFETLFRDRIHE